MNARIRRITCLQHLTAARRAPARRPRRVRGSGVGQRRAHSAGLGFPGCRAELKQGKGVYLGPVLCHWHKEGGIVLGWWLLGERSLPVPPEPALFPGHGTVCYGRDLIAGFLQGWRTTSTRAWQWDLHFAPPSSEGSDSKEEPAVSTWFFPSCNSLQPMQQLPFLPSPKPCSCACCRLPLCLAVHAAPTPIICPNSWGKGFKAFRSLREGRSLAPMFFHIALNASVLYSTGVVKGQGCIL